MIPLIVAAALITVAVLARTHFHMAWVVDDSKSLFRSSVGTALDPSQISGQIKPLYRGSKPIGFEVELNNNSKEQFSVDWKNSFYLQGGATNGGLLDANQSLKAQQEVPTLSDIVLPNSTMKRDLVPFRNLEKVEPKPDSNTTVVAPIIVEPGDPPRTKPPRKKPNPEDEMKHVVITDGAEIKPRPMGLRDTTEEKKPTLRFEMKSSRRRVVPLHSVSESIKELGEGQHGVLLLVQNPTGEQIQIVASFGLTYKKVSK